MKSIKIYSYETCYYTPWVRSFDLSRYKNFQTLVVGLWSFGYVKQVKISGLNQLESVRFGDHSLQRTEILVMDSEND